MDQAYEKALKPAEWNLRMWPDSLVNYLIALHANLELGEMSEACKTLSLAKVGYAGDAGIQCDF